MRLQKAILVTFLALTTVSVSVNAAIINQVDFPEVFTAKEKAVDTNQETIAVAKMRK